MTDPALEAAEEMRRLLASAQTALGDAEPFTFAGKRLAPAQVVAVLEPYLTEARLARIEAVLAERTYTVAPVVEGLVNTGNVSAVMRTAEALGFQAFHIITHEAHDEGVRYKMSERTTQGADKWLDVWPWLTPQACVRHLKAQGYEVVVTHLDARAVPISEIDFTQQTALVFGNERDGVSPEMLALADRTCLVPMAGFTQSFNISVAAAVCLYHARQDRLARQGFHGDLTEAQREMLRAVFFLKSVRSARQILTRAVEEDVKGKET